MENTIQTRFYTQLLEKYLQLKSMCPRETKEVSARKLGVSQQYLNKILRETGNAGLIQKRTVHKVLDANGNVVTDKEEKKYWKNVNKSKNAEATTVKKAKKVSGGVKEQMINIARD